MKLLLTTTFMVALVSPAYAGSYGNEEERVFLDGLQKIENRTDRAQAKPVKQSTYNTPLLRLKDSLLI